MSPLGRVGCGALAVALVACGSDHTPRLGASGVDGRGGTTAVTPGGAGGGGGPSLCAPCAATECTPKLNACSQSETCASCLAMAPYPAIACFADAAFSSVVECACGPCVSACGDLACEARPCASCAATRCLTPYDACASDGECGACIATLTPDPSCQSNPLVVKVYLCMLEGCKAECKL